MLGTDGWGELVDGYLATGGAESGEWGKPADGCLATDGAKPCGERRVGSSSLAVARQPAQSCALGKGKPVFADQ